MKIARKWLVLLLFVLVLSKAIRTKTDGFSLAKTTRCMQERPEWETSVPTIEQTRFKYLGSGVQFYVFESEDGSQILKLFKHYHFPPTPLLKKLPFTSSSIKAREKRIEQIFQSALIAAQNPEATGVIALQINPPSQLLPTLEIADKIGVKHALDLNTTPFLLQKRASPFFETLPSLEMETAIPQLISLFKKIESSDHLLATNYGFIEKVPCATDVGSLRERNSPLTRRELYFLTLELRQWLETHSPEHIATLNDEIDQTSPSPSSLLRS